MNEGYIDEDGYLVDEDGYIIDGDAAKRYGREQAEKRAGELQLLPEAAERKETVTAEEEEYAHNNA